jgi:glucose-6-phosphate 1-dehydrogenase
MTPSSVNISFVLFGITGDLARKKVVPALFNIFRENKLGNNFKMIGFGRSEISNVKFKALIKSYIKEIGTEKDRGRFIKISSYVSGDYNDGSPYKKLKLETQSQKTLFYLSLPPFICESVIGQLGKADMLSKKRNDAPQILIEKPFGTSKKSADDLNQLLSRFASEKQIYRIDHYLGKKTLIDFKRLRNTSFFKKLLDPKHAKEIICTLFEPIGTEGRAGFYDKTGALKDVGQNHLMQMLAIALSVSDSKKKSALKLLSGSTIKRSIRAQYAGYASEEGVADNSKTETFFRLELAVRQKAGKHIDIILQAGKAIDRDDSSIRINFNNKEIGEYVVHIDIKSDRMTFELPKLYPFLLQPLGESEYGSDAYQNIIFSAIKEQKQFFPSMEEITASWNFIERAEKLLLTTPLRKHPKGSIAESIIVAK